MDVEGADGKGALTVALPLADNKVQLRVLRTGTALTITTTMEVIEHGGVLQATIVCSRANASDLITRRFFERKTSFTPGDDD